MVEKFSGWIASDGRLFKTEDEAKSHEFEEAFYAWACERFGVKGNDPLPAEMDALYEAIVEDRMKLLPIFKLLNGGSPPVPPRSADATS